MLGKHKIRILHIWLGRAFWGILMYRWERGMFLLFGKAYSIIRVIFIPIYNIFYAYSNVDINYRANVGPGIMILHTAPGVVISGLAVIGKNIMLTGGNVIGARPGCKQGQLEIGDNCSLGANAVVLGPVKLGNNIKIGACACVLKDFPDDNISLVGVPAKAVGLSVV